ncbi:MAG TPA: TlpA disulfide reductase family protein [Dehalococcoidia bacterium]|nr:TlpA disulfide reductase family protein [Dehalococcoidia bacterium]
MAGKMSKKTWLIVAILIIAVGAIVGIALSRSSSSPSDGTLPIITWDETTLSTLEGTPVVLNFWSISCYWCRQQLPYLENVAQQNEGEIKVIAINMRDSASGIQTFFGDYRPTMIIALDEHMEAFADYCLAYNNTRGAIPFTLFVDNEGIVKSIKIGAFQTEATLLDTLNDVFGTTIP